MWSTCKRRTTRTRMDEMWHGSSSTATCVPAGSSLDKVAPQRNARRSRPEDLQVARGRGAFNRAIGGDEHPERKGGWNSRSEATGAVRAKAPSTARRTRFRTRFSQTRTPQRAQPSNSRNQNVEREREKAQVARDDDLVSSCRKPTCGDERCRLASAQQQHRGSCRPNGWLLVSGWVTSIDAHSQ